MLCACFVRFDLLPRQPKQQRELARGWGGECENRYRDRDRYRYRCRYRSGRVQVRSGSTRCESMSIYRMDESSMKKGVGGWEESNTTRVPREYHESTTRLPRDYHEIRSCMRSESLGGVSTTLSCSGTCDGLSCASSLSTDDDRVPGRQMLY